MNDYWLTPQHRVSDFQNAWVPHGAPEGSANSYHASIAAGQIEVATLLHEWYQYNPNNGRITIDPPRLVTKLQGHLAAYAAQLRDQEQVDRRTRFERRFDFEYDLSQTDEAIYE